MFYGQCWKCGERWALGTASTCKCPDETPKRKWVGLTDEETVAIELGLRIPTGYRDAYDLSLRDFAKAIEAKLKENNFD
jgi:hypothetical protein